MATTEITTTNAHPKLTSLTIGIIREVGTHMEMTADDNCDIRYAGYARKIASDLVKLLEEEPAIDQSFEMLTVATQTIIRLVADTYEYREYQSTDPTELRNLVEAYRIIAERNGERDFAWLEPIEQWVKEESEQDDEDDDE